MSNLILKKKFNKVHPDLTIHLDDFDYKIKAIIQHHGNELYIGHYKTLLYINNKWVVCDDNNIQETSYPDIEHGYIYVYERYEHSDVQPSPLQSNQFNHKWYNVSECLKE